MAANHIFLAQIWLQTQYAEWAGCHGVTCVSTPEGTRPPTSEELSYATVHRSAFHDFLLSKSAPVHDVVTKCIGRRWVAPMECLGPGMIMGGSRYYWIFPAVNEPMAEQAEPVPEVADDRRAHHGADFRSVDWFGESYTFTPTQAACVKVLWEHWKQGTPEIGDQTILEEADSASNRLNKVFRDCPAWGTMIVPGETKGTRRLSPPDGSK